MFLPGESQGQRSLVGGRLWGRKESDTTEFIAAGGSEVKASACNAGDLGSIPGSRRSPGDKNFKFSQFAGLLANHCSFPLLIGKVRDLYRNTR